MVYHAVARSFCECNLAICMEATTPFRLNAQGERGSNPLRMDFTVTHSELFHGQEWRKGKNLPFEPTVIKSCAPSNLGKEVKIPVLAIMAAVKRKINNYRTSS